MAPRCKQCQRVMTRRRDDTGKRVWCCEFCEFRALANAIMRKGKK